MSLDLKRSIVIEIDATGAVVGSRRVQDALKDIDRASRSSSKGLDKMTDSAKSTARSMDTVAPAAKAAMAYLSIQTVTSFAKSILDAGVAMDSLRRSFVAITGSQAGAADELAFLRSEADRLGQSFFDLAPSFKSIAASARGTALEGEAIRKVFSSVTEASTALGMSTSDTEGALRALGQMISKGTVQAEELRGQLGERLPGAFQLAAKAMGVSTKALGKMLEQGEVLATDMLPKLAEELHKAYGAAAQTAALESGQAALNRLSESWNDFKNSLYYSEPAVAGINAVAAALRELADESNSLSKIRDDMFRIGEVMSSPGFLAANRDARLKMLNLGGASSYRGKVNRDDVRAAQPPATLAEIGASLTAAEEKARKRAYEKMIEDGKKAEEAITKYGEEYEQRRIDAIAEGVEARKRAAERDLEIVAEFSEEFRKSVLGETALKLAQLEEQERAYRKAGVDELALAKWVEAKKKDLATDWRTGAIRGLEAYADSSKNAAQAAEEVFTKSFQGMEEALTDFVTTGKVSFSDFADSVIRDMTRMMVQQNVTGPLAEWFKNISFGGASSAAGTGYAGELSHLMSVNAKGNVFTSSGLHAYVNSVVDRPTVFPFAKGIGLMGEAGPEAIMPLKRGSDGSLGVSATAPSIVINQIEDSSRAGQVNRRQEGGTTVIDMFVEQIEAKIASNMSRRQGPVYNTGSSVWGLSGKPGPY